MEEQPVETTLYSLADAPPKEPERRLGGERHLSLLRVGSMMIGQRRELCLIKNVSAGGMLIRAYCPVPPGTRLSIELKHGEPVSGTACWTKDDCIGVTFDEQVDVLALLATSMTGPRPRMPRIEIDRAAWVREGAVVHRVRAVNISQGGIKIETSRDLSVGAEVTATLPGLAPCAGVIRWKEGGAYGITFNRVIPLPALVAWLQEQREQLRAAG